MLLAEADFHTYNYWDSLHRGHEPLRNGKYRTIRSGGFRPERPVWDAAFVVRQETSRWWAEIRRGQQDGMMKQV